MSAPQFDPGTLKADQRHTWASTASGWMKWWPTQGQALQPVGDRLCEMAGIRPGQRVLDIATGIGEPALTAAQLVGPSGHVLATDIAPEMIEFGTARAAEMGLRNVEFREMDAEAMDLPENSFDAILCRFGLMFLPNLDADLQNMLRLLVPDGRLAAAVWSTIDRVPSAGMARTTIMRELGWSSPPPGTPDPFSLSDPVALMEKLKRAGFTGVHAEIVDAKYEWPSPDAYVQFAQDMMAIVKTALAEQPAERKSQILESIREAASEHATSDGTVRVTSEAILVVGRRA